jgi:hypothetical protein
VFVEHTSRIILSCEFEVDRSTTEFGSASLYGCYQRAPYALTTLAFSDVDIGQP